MSGVRLDTLLWFLGSGIGTSHAPCQIALDKSVEVTIQHTVDVARLVLGAQVLDHGVWVQHVAADLRTEAGVDVLTTQLGQLRLPLLDLYLNESAFQKAHRVFSVL